MMSLKCEDLALKCPTITEGKTKVDVKKAWMEHAHKAHSYLFKDKNEKEVEDLNRKIEVAIH